MTVLKHLSETYRIPAPMLLAVAIAGLVLFWVVMGKAIHAWLMARWPEFPASWAIAAAVVVPPAIALGVGVVGAIHDKLAGNTIAADSGGETEKSADERA